MASLASTADSCLQTKMVYVASLNDQVVPSGSLYYLFIPSLLILSTVYSGLFTTASHPLILRALYVDGDAYQYGFPNLHTFQ